MTRKWRPGSTIRLPVNTFDSNDPAGSVTVTGLTAANVKIYKDGNLVERASDAGESVSIDYDGITGRHQVVIDTANDTTAGFYTAGSQFQVAADGLTIDAGSVNAWIGGFELGYEGSIFDTYISALASQTRFTIPVGPAEADALNEHPILIFGMGQAIQFEQAYIKDYTIATGLEIFLDSDPGIITKAVNDSVSILPLSSVGAVKGYDATALMYSLRKAVYGRVEGATTSGTFNNQLTGGEFQIRALDGSVLPADGLKGQALGFIDTQADGSTAVQNPNADRVCIDYHPGSGDAIFGYANDTDPTQHPFNNVPAVGDLWVSP